MAKLGLFVYFCDQAAELCSVFVTENEACSRGTLSSVSSLISFNHDMCNEASNFELLAPLVRLESFSHSSGALVIPSTSHRNILLSSAITSAKALPQASDPRSMDVQIAESCSVVLDAIPFTEQQGPSTDFVRVRLQTIGHKVGPSADSANPTLARVCRG